MVQEETRKIEQKAAKLAARKLKEELKRRGNSRRSRNKYKESDDETHDYHSSNLNSSRKVKFRDEGRTIYTCYRFYQPCE